LQTYPGLLISRCLRSDSDERAGAVDWLCLLSRTFLVEPTASETENIANDRMDLIAPDFRRIGVLPYLEGETRRRFLGIPRGPRGMFFGGVSLGGTPRAHCYARRFLEGVAFSIRGTCWKAAEKKPLVSAATTLHLSEDELLSEAGIATRADCWAGEWQGRPWSVGTPERSRCHGWRLWPSRVSQNSQGKASGGFLYGRSTTAVIGQMRENVPPYHQTLPKPTANSYGPVVPQIYFKGGPVLEGTMSSWDRILLKTFVGGSFWS